MKNLRFAVKPLVNSARHWALALVLVAALLQPGAFALAEDDLPPPMGEGFNDEIPLGDPAPQLEAEESAGMPPAIGDPADSLPDPSVSSDQERAQNQVNRPVDDDDVFLPTPNAQDNYNYAPLGSATSPHTQARWEEQNWKTGMQNRPAFSLHLGIGSRNYVEKALDTRKNGYSVAASWRFYNIGQTVFLHAYAGGTFYRIGDFGNYQNLSEFVFHVGPMLEVGIGRRLSLYGSFLRRSGTLRSDPAKPGRPHNSEALKYVEEETLFRPGLGAIWDFYVIPHGSLGVRVHVEQDIFMAMLTMAIEPTPPRRMNLNFRDMN